MYYIILYGVQDSIFSLICNAYIQCQKGVVLKLFAAHIPYMCFDCVALYSYVYIQSSVLTTMCFDEHIVNMMVNALYIAMLCLMAPYSRAGRFNLRLHISMHQSSECLTCTQVNGCKPYMCTCYKCVIICCVIKLASVALLHSTCKSSLSLTIMDGHYNIRSVIVQLYVYYNSH